MGVMDKFLNYMKLNEDEDGYYDDDYYDDDIEDTPAPKKMSVVKDNDDLLDDKPARKSTTSKVTQMRQPSTRKISNGSGMEVCVIKPTTIEDAREITETLLANRTVVPVSYTHLTLPTICSV